MKKNRFILLIGILFAVLFMTGCASVELIQPCLTEDPAGFFSGLWHGIIAPITWIVSAFSDSIAVYDVSNTGWWYDFGFLLGLGFFGGSTSTVTKKVRKKR